MNKILIKYLLSNYIKTFLNVLGNNNGPTRFLSTDTIRLSAYLKSEVIVDINPPN